jgi:hypothetical protein
VISESARRHRLYLGFLTLQKHKETGFKKGKIIQRAFLNLSFLGRRKDVKI